MQADADKDPYFWIETRRDADTLMHTTMNNILSLRLASVRSGESQAQALTNQDYVQVSMRKDDATLCFCVCDGVGSSYRGDIAAHYLGTLLVRWLQTLPVANQSAERITAQLRSNLEAWACEAQRNLLQLAPLPQAPTLVREALGELCATHGSETVFLGGVLTQCPTLEPAGEQPVQAFFCWMGNVAARLFPSATRMIALGGTMDGGWSTARGIRGRLVTRFMELPAIERLIIYTDGLSTIEHRLAELNEEMLQECVQQLLQLPGSDDMTMLDLEWLPRKMQGQGA